MAFYEGEPTDHPVNSENLAGIPKDDASEDDSKSKSPDLKIPDEIQNKYEEGNKGHVIEYDKSRLFKVQVGHSDDSQDYDLTQRTFSRYRYVTNKFMDNALEFSTSNQLQLERNGNFSVRKGDVYPLGSRGIESDYPVSLTKKEGKLAFGTPLNNDRVLEVRFSEKGTLTAVLLWPTTGGIESSLTRDIEHEEDPSKKSVGETGRPVSWGDMDYEDSEWSGYFRDNYTELALKYRQNGDLVWSWDVGDPDSEFKTLEDELDEIELSGQRVQVVNTSDQLKLIFYRKDKPDDIDLELTIPKHQEIVNFETGTELEQRFAFEEELIPENIRKNPRQPYHPTDEIWRSTNLTQLLGIQIEQRSIR